MDTVILNYLNRFCDKRIQIRLGSKNLDISELNRDSNLSVSLEFEDNILDSLFIYKSSRLPGKKTFQLEDENNFDLLSKLSDCECVDVLISLNKVEINVSYGTNEKFQEYTLIIRSQIKDIKTK